MPALIPLSAAQGVIWLDQMVNAGLPCYQIGMCVDIQGPLDVAILKRAIEHVAQCHDALRLALAPADAGSPASQGQPQWCVLDTVAVHMPVVDLREQPVAAMAAEPGQPDRDRALALVQRTFSSPAPLHAGIPPWDMLVVRYAEAGYLWMHRYHHLVIDGYGVPMAGQAMVDAYNRLLAGQALDRHEAPSYSELLPVEQAYRASARHDKDLAFWRQRYAVLPPALLPARHAQASGEAPGSGKQVWQLPRALYDQVTAHAAAHGFTVSHFLLALIHTGLSRMHAVDEIVIGVPVHNRTTPRQRQTIGMFASMNPIGVPVDLQRDFTAQMQAVADELRRCLRHQRLPIADINRAVQLGATGRRQIFDVSFSFEAFDADVNLGPARPRFWTLHNGHEPTPLAIAAKDYHRDEGLLLEFVFNRAHLDEGEVQRLIGRLETACLAVLDGFQGPVARLPLIPQAEAHLLQRFNDTSVPFEDNVAIHTLFERCVARHPDRIALVCDGAQLSYADLDARANQLACQLQQGGVQANSLVAIVMGRSIELVVALLGVLKAGAAYVPLDPDHPQARQAELLDEVSPSMVLVQEACLSALPDCGYPIMVLPPARPDAATEPLPPASPAASDAFSARSLAYVIFTSGSTGRPKGVMNEHRAVVNRLVWMQKAYGLEADDSVLQKTPYGFDVSVWEFFWPLTTGARLIMARPGGHQDPAYIAHVIESSGVTTVHFVPSMLQVFLADPAAARCTGLRRVICSGEALPWALQQEVL